MHNTDLDNALAQVARLFPFPGYIKAHQRDTLRPIVAELGRLMGTFKGRRLLDIGSGPMDKTAVLSLLGFECYAVDDLNDPWHRQGDSIKKIRSWAKQLGIAFHEQQRGDYSIPFTPGSFDVVCALSVIEHLHQSPRDFLNAMGSFAKPNGLLVTVVPNAVSLRKRLSVMVGRTNYPPIESFFNSTGEWRGHVREYTLDELVYICGQAGFTPVSSMAFENLANQKLSPPARQLYSLVGRVCPTLRSALLAIASKPPDWSPARTVDQ